MATSSGGLASRLYPLTGTRPSTLAPAAVPSRSKSHRARSLIFASSFKTDSAVSREDSGCGGDGRAVRFSRGSDQLTDDAGQVVGTAQKNGPVSIFKGIRHVCRKPSHRRTGCGDCVPELAHAPHPDPTEGAAFDV